MGEETVVTTENPVVEETVAETTTGVATATTEETVVETPEEKRVVPLAALEAERKKRQELAEQVAYMKGKLESAAPVKEPETATPQAPQRPVRPVKPNPSQFEEWADYEQAEAQHEVALTKYEQDLEAYMIEKADYEVTQRLEQRVTQKEKAKTQAQIEQEFAKRLKKAAETDPDLPLLLSDDTLPVSPAMAESIKESEVGPEMLRFIANNREVAARLAQLNPLTAAREMGKIEAQILATPKPQPKKVSGAPEPITTVAPKGVAEEFDPEKAPMEDYYKVRTQQLYRTG